MTQPPFDAGRAISRPDPGFRYDRLGFPGQVPFTRGIHPAMYAARPWTIRQYAGYGTAAETNRRYKYLIDRGQTGLSVAFDLPTQMGYDPDDPMARGEVGKAGVSIAVLDDLVELFEGIPLEKVTVSMTINATAPILLAMLLAAAEERGVPWEEVGGTTQNDILKEFVARGCYIYPPGPSLRFATDLAEFACRRLPRWNFVSVSGYHIREAGSTAAQELGFTLAHGACYVAEAMKRGLDADTVGRRVSFFFNSHNRFLEEVAKFRAARRLWARILRDRFGALDPRSAMLRFHAQTAGSTLTAQQPQNNVIRVALQALAAILGGAQSLHTNAMDEALALPTERAVSVALRTQQILANECGIADAVDPLGGSWHLERETDRLEREAEALLEEVEAQGGVLEAIARKAPQRAIERSAIEDQKALEAGRRVIVGVNRYVEPEPRRRLPLLKVREKVEERRRRRIEEVRRRRKDAPVRAALERLQAGARGTGNLMEPVLDCVRARATLGEISHALREVFGTFDAAGKP